MGARLFFVECGDTTWPVVAQDMEGAIAAFRAWYREEDPAADGEADIKHVHDVADDEILIAPEVTIERAESGRWSICRG